MVRQRCTKEDCLDLPEKIFVDIELFEWQRRMYEAFHDEIAGEVEGMSEDSTACSCPRR